MTGGCVRFTRDACERVLIGSVSPCNLVHSGWFDARSIGPLEEMEDPSMEFRENSSVIRISRFAATKERLSLREHRDERGKVSSS